MSNILIISCALFNYFPRNTGSVQSFIAPKTSMYKLEVWGAQGSSGGTYGIAGIGGKGGYARGYTNIVGNSLLTIVIGGQGKQTNVFPCLTAYTGGYNGGGYGQEGGGGATHIASYNRGQLSNYVNSQSEIYIVAGGGGGTDGGDTGGAGGGSLGGNGIDIPGNQYNTQGYGYGGTQTEGGIGGNKGIFGRGGNSYDSGTDSCGGGGGGWYGGGGGKDISSPGGGGSGYTGGVSNGYMDSGVREGDGYAIITCLP